MENILNNQFSIFRFPFSTRTYFFFGSGFFTSGFFVSFCASKK